MKMKRIVTFLLGLLLVCMIPMTAGAYDLPSVNLGFTSFMDGAPPSGPGLYFTQYIQYWTSDKFKNAQGNELLPPSAGEDLDAWISLSQFIYQSDTEVMLKGKWGIDVIIPYVRLDLKYANPGPFPMDNGSGMGDILVGPYLQWDPIMGANGPKFMHRLEFQCIFPTGKYDRNKELNQGSNFFSFDPYWAATYFITPRLTVSTRIHYLWNAKNHEPGRSWVAAGAYEIQAGQAIHLNFASSYELVPNRFRVGINGYYLKQFTDTKMNGADVNGTRERVFAIGPGFLYSFNKDVYFFFNSYFETGAENRPEGPRINMRVVYHF